MTPLPPCTHFPASMMITLWSFCFHLISYTSPPYSFETNLRFCIFFLLSTPRIPFLSNIGKEGIGTSHCCSFVLSQVIMSDMNRINSKFPRLPYQFFFPIASHICRLYLTEDATEITVFKSLRMVSLWWFGHQLDTHLHSFVSFIFLF